MRRYILTTTALTLSLFASTNSVVAQVERTGGGASQKIIQEYQQLAAERTTLKAKIEQLQKDLDAAKADAAAMKRERDALKAQAGGTAAAVSQAVAAKQSAEQSLEQSKQRMTELVARFRETAANLKEIETDRNTKSRELADRSAAFDQCAENNLQLYEINNEVLDRYEHVGLFAKVSAAEPFTRITRTRMENLVDDYRARAQELRIKRQASPAKN
jgi:chromosome segregation ATPase